MTEDRSTENKHTYVAIMAGGIGSRFWPVSRTSYPKQFLDILDTGKTFIQQTVERFLKFVPLQNIYVVTADEYVDLTKEQLPLLPAENIVSEPFRKNTAPCIAYISFKLQQKDADATLIVAPADHLILDEAKFGAVCNEAISFADRYKALLTLGIKPTNPNTGYGYIQHEDQHIENSLYKVKTFTEKPNKELAKTFLSSGDFLWNAGIFIWKVATCLDAFQQHLPEMYELFAAEQESFNTPRERAAIESIYPQCTNISIDFGVMEKADNVYVIPASFGWSDLGTWCSAWENIEHDYFGNAVTGEKVIVFDTANSMIHTQAGKLAVVQGLDDFIVVDTKDVLLICQKEKEQEIKEYVAEVKRNMGDKYL
ncbi:MAG TPA: mannose-1-phosphate guanylyltransferase [Chitinophagaceae bacterium]|nr:mannose-1-phosphate guanylyltransferase [Chitinophagaceae bacterium]